MRFACHRDHGDRSDIAVYDLRGRLLDVPVRDGANWYPQWSPDGRCLLFAQQGLPSTPAVPSTGFDLWMVDAWGMGAPELLLQGPAREAEGRWRPAADD